MSFGARGMPVDRFPNVSPIPANAHHMFPEQVTIHLLRFVIEGEYAGVCVTPYRRSDRLSNL